MSGILHEFGELHPALVHFPVALVTAAAAAETLYLTKKKDWYGEAARFAIAAGAWMSLPAAAAGFAEAAGRTFAGGAASVFSAHWVLAVSTAVLAFLAYALGEGSRRSGQVWEQGLYRLFLLLAAVAALATGWLGGELAHGGEEAGTEAVGFGLTLLASIWY